MKHLPWGMYIHVPFCLRKCPYCDFFSDTDTELLNPYIRALLREMELYKDPSKTIDTIYLGGGTPSLLPPQAIAEILARIGKHFLVAENAEITLEANPGTTDCRPLEGFLEAGVNRINIGVQSFDDRHLNFLGRIHGARQSLDAVDQARKAGFVNLGIDLIYGIPGQDIAGWRRDLEKAVEISPEHLSCYMLGCEPGTPLENQRKKGKFRMPDESEQAKFFLFTIDFLHSNGFAQYEISNFAKVHGNDPRRYQSRHNRKYWDFLPYLGLGPSAHSFSGTRRYWNHRSLKRYLHLLEHTTKPVSGEEILTREQRVIETVMLGLRKTEGIDARAFFHQFGLSPPETTLSGLVEQGCMSRDNSRWALTPLGMSVMDSITSRIISHLLP